MPAFAAHAPHPAVVAKSDIAHAAERYLLLTPVGQATWVETPARATAFPSLREAMRMATRLPSHHRAFGLPCDPAVTTH